MVATVRFERVLALPPQPVANTMYFVRPLGSDTMTIYVAGNDAVPVPIAAGDAIGAGGDASAANQATEIARLTSILSSVDGLEGLLTTLNGADVATNASLAAIQAIGTETYTLANNATLAVGAAGPTVTVPRGAYFFFDAAFSGSSPSLSLQRLGPDGTTWLDVVIRTTAGSGDPVGIPNGSQLRVYNAGSGSLTAVSAVLG